VTPFTGKYLYIDSMIYGLTSFALLVYAVTRALHECDASLLLLIPLAALALRHMLPRCLFPACRGLRFSGCFGAFTASQAYCFPVPSCRTTRWGRVTRFGIAAVLAGAVVIAYLRFFERRFGRAWQCTWPTAPGVLASRLGCNARLRCCGVAAAPGPAGQLMAAWDRHPAC